ncbi:hypothetical protein M8C21_029616 [Ambrosia artemisiifolia]|uniref:Uncharacterized protein n=1 Tax=Ambrosia artemisiifolia TaxID=4212 RepID=A0AAD5CWV2_AMBAR|nr:hypothetical protein M8C21_029616 [Ambrosia artemisiifolia]
MFEKVDDYEFNLDLFREDGQWVDPHNLGNENIQLQFELSDEVIEVSSDSSDDDDSLSENAAPDHEVIKKVTYKFRFPIPFARDCEFQNVDNLRVEGVNGKSVIRKMRSEGSGSQTRYAVTEWKSTMKKLALKNGMPYHIMYFQREGRLVFSRP